jgi:hypothetical protein
MRRSIRRVSLAGTSAMAAMLCLGSTAVGQAASSATYRGKTLRDGDRVTLTVRVLGDGSAHISSGEFAVLCSNRRRISSSLDVTVPIKADGSFSLSRVERFSTAVTGAASARETYSGRVSGRTGRLRHTARITGSRATCRAELRWAVQRA